MIGWAALWLTVGGLAGAGLVFLLWAYYGPDEPCPVFRKPWRFVPGEKDGTGI